MNFLMRQLIIPPFFWKGAIYKQYKKIKNRDTFVLNVSPNTARYTSFNSADKSYRNSPAENRICMPCLNFDRAFFLVIHSFFNEKVYSCPYETTPIAKFGGFPTFSAVREYKNYENGE